MEEIDRELMRAETDARERSTSPRSPMSPTSQAPRRPSNEVERVVSASSVSTSSSEGARSRGAAMAGAGAEGLGAGASSGVSMSRVPTSRELERHPTELSRIATARSQHDATVGRSIGSRTRSRRNSTPLPAFGGGKPLPPQLPNQEDYVVEFDGPDDPYHAQNWSTKKKYVLPPKFWFSRMAGFLRFGNMFVVFANL